MRYRGYSKRVGRAIANEADKPQPWPWERAHGPVPADLWQNGKRIASGRPDRDGVCMAHVLEYPGGGLYLQEAGILGWLFCPVVRVAP